MCTLVSSKTEQVCWAEVIILALATLTWTNDAATMVHAAQRANSLLMKQLLLPKSMSIIIVWSPTWERSLIVWLQHQREIGEIADKTVQVQHHVTLAVLELGQYLQLALYGCIGFWHLCSLFYLSPQWKHNPFSSVEAAELPISPIFITRATFRNSWNRRHWIELDRTWGKYLGTRTVKVQFLFLNSSQGYSSRSL
jgi:hypothetical protein